MKSSQGSTDIPRYWITLDGEIIWDYPRDFLDTLDQFPYFNAIQSISDVIRYYLDTPIKDLTTKNFEIDAWGLTDIFLVCDKRVGVRHLTKVIPKNSMIQKIIDARRNHRKNME
jgi:hypothetical protein